MPLPILASPIAHESDVVAVRQRARRIAELLGCDAQDQTRFATAVSEIARNAFSYAGGGRAEFVVDGGGEPMLTVKISDAGPGIADLQKVLDGRYQSQTGMGLGILGARRLSDVFRIAPGERGGMVVELGKRIPATAAADLPGVVSAIALQLSREKASDPLAVMREHNGELMRSLDEVRERQDELARLNEELRDTNRGVVALYAELDQRAEQFRRASELKTRFLSNMSHEFRTPLNSVLALSRLLLDRIDGPLTDEQERQVRYIRRSAEELTELVNDLLDLAKVEAGRVDVRAEPATVEEIFGGLRGVLRPLLTNPEVDLVFAAAAALPGMMTDRAKIAQILRNFISNALKFTSSGSVRVMATHDAAADRVVFSVSDTGIGIAEADRERIFEEFTQVESEMQRRSKGTGLGLPLSRSLAALLNGSVSVTSRLGRGSTFVLDVPRIFRPAPVDAESGARTRRLLVVDDEESFRYVVRQNLGGRPGWALSEAATGSEALARVAEGNVAAVVLDLNLPDTDGIAVANAILGRAQAPAVVVCTSREITPALRAQASGVRAWLSKGMMSREALAAALERTGGEDHRP